MATIYFGAQVPVVNQNGNWNDVTQWYSDMGNNQGKDYAPGVLLGRLPLLTDTIIMVQWVTSGVAARVLTLTGVNNGVWTGVIEGENVFTIYRNAGLNDPAATWSGTYTAQQINIRSGIVNFNFNNSYEISGGTINGNVINYIDNLSAGTFNGNVSGNLSIYGNPVFNGSLINIRSIAIYSGTFTKSVTSWSNASLGLYGGTYNSASTPTAGLVSFAIYAGTMAANIFTSAYTSLQVVIITGGTLSFSGDIQVGAVGRLGQAFFNNGTNYYGANFTGTNKNITVYGSNTNISIRFGSTSGTVDAGTYTGIVTLLPYTGTNALVEVYGGTYSPPTQILPLINVAYGTGKGINASTLYKNPGFATFIQKVSISGSSDILQSELA